MRVCGMVVAAALAALPIVANAQTPAPQPSADLAAEQPSRVTILEENDSLYFNSDKHYTQGFRISDLFGGTPSPGSWWDDTFDFVGLAGPIFEHGGNTIRRTSVFAGQSIFTPKNLTLKPPDPKDRPYAGWAYGGISLMQETNKHMLENFEIDLGVVGPGSLAKQAQNDFHQFIGAQQAQGWSDQLQHEFGGMLSYERYWKWTLFGDNSFGVDLIPEAGVTAGNVMTYGDVGGMLRIGKGLAADYGPVRVRPSLSGTDYFDINGLDNGHGWYFFVGTQGRAVGHNIFLDGNTFRESRSVPKKIFVGDAEAGFSILWNASLRTDFMVMTRSEEFRGQKTPDEVGTASLSFNW
ncbi:MAG TPA: lipid A deacylase LpxR family protein [Stellaceae bacterium]